VVVNNTVRVDAWYSDKILWLAVFMFVNWCGDFLVWW